MAEVVTVLELSGERNVFEARQAARSIARSLGFRRVEQARLAAAVSEIARRATCDFGGGDARFALSHDDGRARLLVTVRAARTDATPPRRDVAAPTPAKVGEPVARGLAIAERLVDAFAIEREPDGTVVILGRDLPGEPTRDELWELARTCRRALAGLVPNDPREELQRQHRELLLALDEQARAEAEARGSHERLILAVEAAGVGLLEIDPQRGVITGCTNAVDLLGAEELHSIDRVIELIAERHRRSVRRVLCGPLAETEDLEVLTRAGRWLRLRVRPLGDSDDGPRVAALLDITAGVRREDEIRHRLKLEEQLIGIVSHDLRTPLGVVLMGIQALEATGLDAHQRTIVRRIERSGERSIRLVSDLLDFTRARLGSGIPIAPTDVDLSEVAVEIAAAAEISHPGRHVDVTVLGDGRGVWDGERLEQALTNLVENALAYGPPDEPVGVTVDGRREDVVIQIHNGGDPIPTELLPRLFEPLQRGPQANGSGRSIGLGLFIVSQIVSGHGGSVSVRSSTMGTTAEVRLPRRAQPRSTARDHATAAM